jgi:hypothetical protein
MLTAYSLYVPLDEVAQLLMQKFVNEDCIPNGKYTVKVSIQTGDSLHESLIKLEATRCE